MMMDDALLDDDVLVISCTFSLKVNRHLNAVLL